MTIDHGQLDDAARRLKRRELDKVELQARLQEQVRDRLYKEATQAAYLSNVEQAGVIRRSLNLPGSISGRILQRNGLIA